MCLIWTGTGNRLIRWKGFHFLKRLQIAWHIPFLQGFHNRGPSGGMLNRDKKKVYSYIHVIVVLRYQDIHTQSCIMVFASQRWLGVRLDCLSALLTCAVALAAVFVSQDAGKFTSTCNEKRNWLFHVYMWDSFFKIPSTLRNMRCIGIDKMRWDEVI